MNYCFICILQCTNVIRVPSLYLQQFNQQMRLCALVCVFSNRHNLMCGTFVSTLFPEYIYLHGSIQRAFSLPLTNHCFLNKQLNKSILSPFLHPSIFFTVLSFSVAFNHHHSTFFTSFSSLLPHLFLNSSFHSGRWFTSRWMTSMSSPQCFGSFCTRRL